MKKIIVAVTGATGAPLALKVLQLLAQLDVEMHLVISKSGKTTILTECDMSCEEVCKMAHFVYNINDQGATISSG